MPLAKLYVFLRRQRFIKGSNFPQSFIKAELPLL